MSSETDQFEPAIGAAGGGIWTAVARIFSQGSQLVIFVVAARLMTPADFGVFALVSSVIQILALVAMAGWAEYIMNWAGDKTRPGQVLFVALVSGLVMTLMGFGLSFGASYFGDDQVVKPLMQLCAAWVFLGAFGSGLNGVLNWQNKLTASALAMLVSDLVNLVVSCWALFLGHGVFALAYGRLASGVCWIILTMVAGRVMPDPRINRDIFQSLMVFSMHILAVRLLINVKLLVATFVIGGFLGAASVGYFRAAQRVVGAFVDVIGEPTRVLAWALFRKTRNEHGGKLDGFQDRANDFFSVLLLLAIPVFVGLAVMAEDLTVGLLGSEWRPAAPVVVALALANLIMVVGHALEPILSIAGNLKILPPLVLLHSVLGIAITFLAAPYGLMAVAWAQVISAVLVLLIDAWALRKFAGIRWNDIIWRLRIMAPCVALACILGLVFGRTAVLADLQPLIRAALMAMVMLAIYASSLLTLDARFRDRTRQFAFRKQQPKAPSIVLPPDQNAAQQTCPRPPEDKKHLD